MWNSLRFLRREGADAKYDSVNFQFKFIGADAYRHRNSTSNKLS
jgi:hypothetical protein